MPKNDNIEVIILESLLETMRTNGLMVELERRGYMITPHYENGHISILNLWTWTGHTIVAAVVEGESALRFNLRLFSLHDPNFPESLFAAILLSLPELKR